jgi:hypothetical protein
VITCGFGDPECGEPAVAAIFFRDVPVPFHAHVCSRHEAEDREWFDVTRAEPIVDGVCQVPCSPKLFVMEPAELT